MKIVARTDPGQVRKTNEDFYGFDESRQVAVLADGMGGLNAGEVASKEAVRSFLAALEHPFDAKSMSQAISISNDQVFELSHKDTAFANMGTTVVACARIKNSRWAVAHVGDSRAYLFRDGQLSQLTSDHSVVQQLVDEGALTAEEAWHASNRHIITRAIGLESQVAIDVGEIECIENDMILLCSDGLTDLLQDDAIANVLQDGPTLAAAADQLVTAANRAGGTDNITVLLIQ